jgi:hypothetical protein
MRSKAFLRSVAVFILVLGVGFFVLGALSKYETTDNIQNASITNQNNFSGNATIDEFSKLGGKTPQETLSLLVKALEKNNVILAVKYFIPESRETESEDLTRLQDANILGDLIKSLKNVRNGKNIDQNNYSFEVYDETGEQIFELKFSKNNDGFWKVISI